MPSNQTQNTTTNEVSIEAKVPEPIKREDQEVGLVDRIKKAIGSLFVPAVVQAHEKDLPDVWNSF